MSKNKINGLSGLAGLVYSTNPDAMPTYEDTPIETLPPQQQLLYVSLDKKKRAGKVVTLIEGFVGNEDDLSALGKDLKTKCGVGGSAKDGEIIIQGDHKVKVLDWLKQWGYKVKAKG